MRKILQKAILLAVLFYIALGQRFIFAQVVWCDPLTGGIIPNPPPRLPRLPHVPPVDYGVSTAIGCLSVANTSKFAASILEFALGVGGGIAFLLMIVGVFQITTSSGSPEKLKAGQELITSALIGLLMMVFSVFLLKLIGVDILGLDSVGF